MLRLPPFRYLAPRTMEQATQMLAQEGEQAMLVAGGTDLYPNMKRRQFTPPVVIGLRGIAALKGISGTSDQGMRVGAGVTLTTWQSILSFLSIMPHWPAQRALFQLRNFATWERLAVICSWILAVIITTRPSSGVTPLIIV